MNPSRPFRLGLDLGGTKIEAALLSPDGAVVARQRVPSPAAQGYEPMLRAAADLALELARLAPPGAPIAFGAGVPGSIRPDTGLIQNANSTCLIGRPLQLDLSRLLGQTVAVDNDANCFALAEAKAGAGRGHGLVFGVIMGTGCGGGLVIDGRVRRGPHRIAGEWGHASVAPHGPPCYCGKRGCVETLISGSGVERQFLARTGRALPMAEIVARARDGETECSAAFDRFLEDFGRCLGGLVSTLDPDAVVLGGGLSNVEELYDEGARRVRRHAFHDDLRTPILRNELGDSAGVIGAAWLGQTAT